MNIVGNAIVGLWGLFIAYIFGALTIARITTGEPKHNPIGLFFLFALGCLFAFIGFGEVVKGLRSV